MASKRGRKPRASTAAAAAAADSVVPEAAVMQEAATAAFAELVESGTKMLSPTHCNDDDYVPPFMVGSSFGFDFIFMIYIHIRTLARATASVATLTS